MSTLTDADVAAALRPLSDALAADDYRLDVARDGDFAVTLTVVALDGACAECLVPAEITRRMAEQRLTAAGAASDAGWRIQVRYPADTGH
ncbi:hypothetical protein GCM10023205_80620 [Yinghuangia aomiensis]|uniref:Fe-S cluster biogenesis protein NfuA, 4Fe-4S-binding domain n=1 Tax=Yinghuangia aomiensis TaxID=676205 RepID=A0ABP9IEM5_9ACTN